ELRGRRHAAGWVQAGGDGYVRPGSQMLQHADDVAEAISEVHVRKQSPFAASRRQPSANRVSLSAIRRMAQDANLWMIGAGQLDQPRRRAIRATIADEQHFPVVWRLLEELLDFLPSAFHDRPRVVG